MSREEWSYLAGSAMVTIGCAAMYWPAGFVAAGMLLLLPRFAEWAWAFRISDREID
jgi:UPF0716 family protein affecting phage T7 exclusion